MNEKLEHLLTDGVIDAVVGRLKSGKEADVWLVEHGGQVVAAKLYKEREARNFKNNAGYKEGRAVRNSRTARAIAKGSNFGRKAEEDAWKSSEADALYKLHAGGVRVPTPVLFYEGVLLMQLVSDEEGQPAPRLIEAVFTPEVAQIWYRDLRQQIVRMLCCDVIHGDLSPYNVLVGLEGPVIIDFPQVVGAAHNAQAFTYFQRDVDNLRNFFAGFDPSLRGRSGDARAIWRAYEKRELHPDWEVPEVVAPEPEGQQQRRESGPAREVRGRPEGEPRREFREREGAPAREFRGRPAGEPRREFREREGAPAREFRGRPEGEPRREFREREGAPAREFRGRPEGEPRREYRERDGAPAREFRGRPEGEPRRDFREREGAPAREFRGRPDGEPRRDFREREGAPQREFRGRPEGAPQREFRGRPEGAPQREFRESDGSPPARELRGRPDGDPRRDFRERDGAPAREFRGRPDGEPRRDGSSRPQRDARPRGRPAPAAPEVIRISRVAAPPPPEAPTQQPPTEPRTRRRPARRG